MVLEARSSDSSHSPRTFALFTVSRKRRLFRLILPRGWRLYLERAACPIAELLDGGRVERLACREHGYLKQRARTRIAFSQHVPGGLQNEMDVDRLPARV